MQHGTSRFARRRMVLGGAITLTVLMLAGLYTIYVWYNQWYVPIIDPYCLNMDWPVYAKQGSLARKQIYYTIVSIEVA